MNKVIVNLLVFAGLLCLCSFAFAQEIKNPLGADSFKYLFLNIAAAVGKLITGLSSIMFVVAGIFYLTSAGSPEGINRGKTTLIYAIAGTAIGLSATAIAEFIQKAVE